MLSSFNWSENPQAGHSHISKEDGQVHPSPRDFDKLGSYYASQPDFLTFRGRTTTVRRAGVTPRSRLRSSRFGFVRPRAAVTLLPCRGLEDARVPAVRIFGITTFRKLSEHG
jgi:hypothetical protein